MLIVDDHRVTRLGLAEMLTDAGYTVVTAGTFPDARRILKEAPPDLLIADVRLGSFNGLQLVISGPNRVPAIVITGYDDAVLEAEARRSGAEYLVKPFDPEKLLVLIRQKLGNIPATFSVPRRWRRKEVAGLTAQVGTQPARIVDVSYGGVRFEIRPGEGDPPPDSFQLQFSSAMSLQADLVWKSMLTDNVWVCGAAVWPEESSARQWFGLVDTAT
ncbi:MAG TPA: response regulator [Anaerolineales bacterium]|nr:response regulator [Anaerolineales bacterium]